MGVDGFDEISLVPHHPHKCVEYSCYIALPA